jgi:hypothetical protein
MGATAIENGKKPSAQICVQCKNLQVEISEYAGIIYTK